MNKASRSSVLFNKKKRKTDLKNKCKHWYGDKKLTGAESARQSSHDEPVHDSASHFCNRFITAFIFNYWLVLSGSQKCGNTVCRCSAMLFHRLWFVSCGCSRSSWCLSMVSLSSETKCILPLSFRCDVRQIHWNRKQEISFFSDI